MVNSASTSVANVREPLTNRLRRLLPTWHRPDVAEAYSLGYRAGDRAGRRAETSALRCPSWCAQKDAHPEDTKLGELRHDSREYEIRDGLSVRLAQCWPDTESCEVVIRCRQHAIILDEDEAEELARVLRELAWRGRGSEQAG